MTRQTVIRAITYCLQLVIQPRDRSVRTIFGDAAAATLITSIENAAGMIRLGSF